MTKSKLEQMAEKEFPTPTMKQGRRQAYLLGARAVMEAFKEWCDKEAFRAASSSRISAFDDCIKYEKAGEAMYEFQHELEPEDKEPAKS